MTIKLLIVDHYDSYTNNLLKLLNPHIKVNIINHDKIIDCSIIDSFDAIILSPGPGRSDNDKDFGVASKLIKYALEINKPLLGICLGHQGLATTLCPDTKLSTVKKIKHGHRIPIQFSDSRLFNGIHRSFNVVTYNSLTISDPNDALKESNLKVTATELHDSESIMALEHIKAPLFGVQFHPESIESEFGRQIMQNFLNISLEYANDVQEIPQSVIDSSSIALESQKSMPKTQPAFNVTEEIVDLPVNTDEVFDTKVRQLSGLGSIWLDSAKLVEGVDSTSYLAKPSIVISYKLSDKSLNIKTNTSYHQFTIDGSFWDWFDKLQRLIESLTNMKTHEGFTVGWITALGYELGKESLEGYSTCQTKLDDVQFSSEQNQVDALLLFCNEVLTYDHINKVWRQFALEQIDGIKSNDLELDDAMRFILDNLTTTSKLKEHYPRKSNPQIQTLPYKCKHTPQAYINAIEEARRQIEYGESYELCLTTRFVADANHLNQEGCWDVYKHLRCSNPAPYAAFIDIPSLNLAILSSSPERFMKVGIDRLVEMKPIKGTVGRNKEDKENDSLLATKLQNDEKERAENLMIVDLIRSDLLSFCEPETVQVPHLMCIETFEKVHQLVSTIRGRRRANVGVVEGIKRSFPPGSMTGSPKLRSVKILEKLERSNRGFYSGCIGYIGVNGCTDLSVVIRTIVYGNKELKIGAGGAITYPSIAQNEWEEVLTKARSVVSKLIEY
ncbi:ADC synthase [Wallemia mellicola]|nr:ADC synthase [Wallemia mellicola]